MGTRALVIGGAGFIGSALVRELGVGTQVRVLDNLSTGHAENLKGLDGIDLIVGSILDEDLLRRAMQDVHTVYHLACLGVRQSIHSPRINHDTNATGTLMVLQVAREARVRRFVYTSTSEVYGSAQAVPMHEDHPTLPHTVYGAAKLAGEAYTRAYHRTYGMPTVIVRPFNSYGPRSHHEGDSGEVSPRFIVRAMNGLAPVIFGSGSQTRDFTYVHDTARGIAMAAQTDKAIGRTINLGSGNETTIESLARVILDLTGRNDLRVEHEEARPGDVDRLLADRKMAAEILGWEPLIDLERGVRLLLDWHQETATDWQVALKEATDRNWL